MNVYTGQIDDAIEFAQNQQNSSDANTKPLEQIEKMGKMVEAGVISEEEFEEKKLDLLDHL